MAFKCLDCGHIFDEGEEGFYEEDYGIFWGSRMTERQPCCPSCNSEYFEEACRCERCKGVFLEDELEEGLCEECCDELEEEYRHDPKKCFELAKDETESVELNAFLVSMLKAEQINEILLKCLTEQGISIDCTHFITSDRLWFLCKGKEVK